ncbi:MAG: diguanylate cyclase domain-containing protein [Thermoanaerobaculum sp.]
MKAFGLALALVAVSGFAQDTRVVDRLPFSLAGKWWFRLGHDPAWSSPFREKTHWQLVSVPGPWEKQGFAGYNGHAWYRITFQLSSELGEESLGVDLGFLGDVDEVFLNGQRLGERGSFPPFYEPATLQRRIYQLPRVSLRPGELNELAVHVYNQKRFGGFLGPSPTIDRYERLLAKQTARDVVLWASAVVLGVLALFHTAVALFGSGGREHWPWALFLTSFAFYEVTYAAFGPALLFSPGLAFRLNVAFLLAAVASFPLVLAAAVGHPAPTLAHVFASLMAVGGGFALLWRQIADLYLWVYVAEAAIPIIVVLALWIFSRGKPHDAPSRWPLAATGVGFFASVLADVAVDLCVLPRPSMAAVVLYSSFGVIPFAFALTLTLTTRWARQHGASFLPHLGLLPWSSFTLELRKRLAASPPAPFSVAFIRFSTVAGTPVDVEKVAPHLRRQLRHCDLLARFSRETVAVLVDGLDEREALAYVERVRRALRQLPDRVLLRPAAGLAAVKAGRNTSVEDILKAAEAALYAARSEGGDATATAP